MKHQLTAMALLLVISSAALGQRPRGPMVNVVGTTWTLFYKECKKNKWSEHSAITFLSGGRIKGSGGSWRLTGNKLLVNAPDDLVIVDMRVTISGSQMTGTADLSLANAQGFCVRLVRQRR